MLPQVLNNYTFVISGRLGTKGDKSGITTEQQQAPIITRNGGQIYRRDITNAVDAQFILITSQKEISKELKKINKAIICAYRYRWPIISKEFVLDADRSKVLPNLELYMLDISVLKDSPQTSLIYARVMKQSELLDRSKKCSAHRELKVKLRESRRPREESYDDLEKLPRKPPKRPATGYVTFLRQQYKNIAKENIVIRPMSETNEVIRGMWKALSEEEKDEYKKQGITDFQRKVDKWNTAPMTQQPMPLSNEEFAFERLDGFRTISN